MEINIYSGQMKDQLCVDFLQWVLPKLGLRWKGFKKVRQQVCKRIKKRIRELNLADLNAYQKYLQTHDDEWNNLQSFCVITISRFFRDRFVYRKLMDDYLPQLILHTQTSGRKLRILSLGSASGEEVYSLAIILNMYFNLYEQYEILGIEIDKNMLDRAKFACYSRSSVKEASEMEFENAFIKRNESYCLKDSFKKNVNFLAGDIRKNIPDQNYDIVCCRNLAFTYFNKEIQQHILAQIIGRLNNNGLLIIGSHETLPETVPSFQQIENFPLYKKMDN